MAPQRGPRPGWTWPGQCHPDHVALGLRRLPKVHGHGLGIAKQKSARGGEVQQQRHGMVPSGVNVRRNRVERDAPHFQAVHRQNGARGIPVRGFVNRDGKQHGQRKHRNGLNEVGGFHDAGSKLQPGGRGRRALAHQYGPSPLRSTTVVGSSAQAPASMTPAICFSKRARISAASLSGSVSPVLSSVVANKADPWRASSSCST